MTRSTARPGTESALEQQDREQRNERLRKRLMVRFGVDALDKTAFTMNVSLSGAMIRTNNVFKPGTTLQVELPFPDKTFVLYAKVIWAKKVPPSLSHVLNCGMGIRFVDTGDDWEDYWQRRSK